MKNIYVMDCYACGLRPEKLKAPFCELCFRCYIFPHAFNKREELNKSFVIATIAMFQNQIGVTICCLCFPWSKKEVGRKYSTYSLVPPASATPGQEVRRSASQSFSRNCSPLCCWLQVCCPQL